MQKKIATLLALLLMSFTASANSNNNNLNISDLTAEQQLLVQQQVQAMKNKPQNPEELEKWVTLGRSIGLAVGETAQALNTEANEFAKSTLGIWAIVLITYKVIGADIIGLLFGVLWLCITIPTWIWIYNKNRFIVLEKYNNNNKNKEIIKEINEGFGEIEHFAYFLTLASIVTIGLVTIF